MIIKTRVKKTGKKTAIIFRLNANALNREKYSKFFKLILFIHSRKKNKVIVKNDKNKMSL